MIPGDNTTEKSRLPRWHGLRYFIISLSILRRELNKRKSDKRNNIESEGESEGESENPFEFEPEEFNEEEDYYRDHIIGYTNPSIKTEKYRKRLSAFERTLEDGVTFNQIAGDIESWLRKIYNSLLENNLASNLRTVVAGRLLPDKRSEILRSNEYRRLSHLHKELTALIWLIRPNHHIRSLNFRYEFENLYRLNIRMGGNYQYIANGPNQLQVFADTQFVIDKIVHTSESAREYDIKRKRQARADGRVIDNSTERSRKCRAKKKLEDRKKNNELQ
jgi:hypothetical protein